MAKKKRSSKQSPARRRKTRAADPPRRARAARGDAAAANAQASPAARSGPAAGEPEYERSADGRPKQFSIPLDLVEHLLLGPTDDRRVLQDSPLLGDVWTAYAFDPGNVQDVLITPLWSATAAGVASMLPGGLKLRERSRSKERNPVPASRERDAPKIAYLQGLVAASLFFDDVLCVLVPLTQWWHSYQVTSRMLKIRQDPEKLERLLARPIEPPGTVTPSVETFSSLERYIALAGLIHWVGKLERPKNYQRPPKPQGTKSVPPLPSLPAMKSDDAFALYKPYIGEIVKAIVGAYRDVQDNLRELLSQHADIISDMPEMKEGADDAPALATSGFIFQVSLNRPAAAAMDKSVPAIKADAAKTLFKVSCKNIIWAVLDSGIHGTHSALCARDSDGKPLQDKQGNPISRVLRTFDFTKIREIVSNDEQDMEEHDFKNLAAAAKLDESVARDHLQSLARNAKDRMPINWDTVEKLITIKNSGVLSKEPASPHGTHVAGIIGADGSGSRYAGGVCPDIRLYDFRVLGRTQKDTEFAIIAALQYIRYVNERHSNIKIHGANLSLSIPHNVRNYACGRTPICNECERLVESGVVVVAAAGNRGFQRFETKEGVFENYAAFSITDPGNSESVLTVGSTHGNWPHTYGVSFFSSRGPTGDGRLKPDLVAPGERVQSIKPGDDWGPESGTSMAAPHVSGAAAMLLARYEELIGQPRRVKRILCESATNLGRERSFQGHGMLDVLRAFQSI